MLEAQRSRRFHDIAEFRVSVFLTAERGRISPNLLNRLAPSRSGGREIFSQRVELRLESNGLRIPRARPGPRYPSLNYLSENLTRSWR